MHDRRVLAVDELADLLLRGPHDVRVAVPGARDADAGGEVEVAFALDVVEVNPFTVVDHDGRCLLEQRRELGHSVLLGRSERVVDC